MAKIMIVDDSKLIRIQLKTMIEKLGHDIVFMAENGQIAYDEYSNTQPDLVTMDINMPILDGLGAVQKIIADYPMANIIMISSIDDRSLTYECIGAGAIDFINKPIQIEELEEKINSILNS